MEMDIEIAMNMEIERGTETETDIGRGKDYLRNNFLLAHGGCSFVATLQFCASRGGGELTELLPWTWASSARQWLFVSNIESRWVKRECRWLDWVCTHRPAEGCTRSQTLFATWA